VELASAFLNFFEGDLIIRPPRQAHGTLAPHVPPNAVFEWLADREGGKVRYDVLLDPEFTYEYGNLVQSRLATISRVPSLRFYNRVNSAGIHTAVMDYVSVRSVWRRHSTIRSTSNGYELLCR